MWLDLGARDRDDPANMVCRRGDLPRGERAFATSPLASAEMRTRTYFAHRIDMLDAAGELLEHLAGVDDYEVAEATWLAGQP